MTGESARCGRVRASSMRDASAHSAYRRRPPPTCNSATAWLRQRNTVEHAAWPRRASSWTGRISCDAGDATNPEKHMYDEFFLVIEGRGNTDVWRVFHK